MTEYSSIFCEGYSSQKCISSNEFFCHRIIINLSNTNLVIDILFVTKLVDYMGIFFSLSLSLKTHVLLHCQSIYTIIVFVLMLELSYAPLSEKNRHITSLIGSKLLI